MNFVIFLLALLLAIIIFVLAKNKEEIWKQIEFKDRDNSNED